MLRAVLVLVFICHLSGCANYGSEKFFERDTAAVAAAHGAVGQPGRATVFYFRERALMQPLMYIPVPPAYFAVDERLVSIMPLGSHVVLSLEPGKHKFSGLFVVGNWPFPVVINRYDAEVNLVAGQTYYVGHGITLIGDPMRSVNAESGEQTIASSELAQLIHNPATVDSFVARVRNADAKGRSSTSQSSSVKPQTSAVADALPTSSQVTNFLEGLATVAFAALLIVGAATGASYGSVAIADLPSFPAAPPPSSIQSPHVSSTFVDDRPRVSSTRVDELSSWRTSNGTLADIVQSKERLEVRMLPSGVKYKIEDGRIAGSDGSRYRVLGSQVIADTGQTYRVIGNNLWSSDGRTCTKIGTMISCR